MRNLTFKWQKMLAMLLCISMLVSIFPVNVFASDIYDVTDDTSIIEPGTYTFDEHGHLICDECGKAGGHSEDCSFYIDTATNSNAIKDDDVDDCECGGTDGNHFSGCEFYVAIDECNCDFIDGIHANTCPEYKEVDETPACECEGDIHDVDCPLYEEVDDKPGNDSVYDVDDDVEIIIVCTCGTETETHDVTCGLYEEPVIDFKYLNDIQDFYEFFEIIYKNPDIIEDLTNDEKEELILKTDELFVLVIEPSEEDNDKYNYLINLINSYIVIICDECGQMDGLHLETCSSWLCTECGNHEHSIDCSHYISNCAECGEVNSHLETCSQYIVVCAECDGKNNLHAESCSSYICDECGGNRHLATCSKAIIMTSPAPQIKCEECGASGEHLEDCSLWVCDECGKHEHTEDCSKYIKVDIVCNECNEKNGIHLETCSHYIKKCSECEGINEIHTEKCSLYVCDECEAHDHLETCSKYVKICEECQGKNDEHLKTCSQFIDKRTLYEKLLDTESLIDMYDLLVDNKIDIQGLVEEEIDELIWHTGLIADDEDLEIKVLMILYKLPNAPDNPWKTLESDYIYFDLSAGSITLNASTYSGYLWVDGIATNFTGTHSAENQYYVFQSNNGDVTQEYDDFGVPVYERVTYNGEDWGSYITNNTNIAGVVSNWTSAAGAVGRISTDNYITVTGNGTYDITIDNLWSTYNPSSTSRTTGGIGFDTSGGVLTVHAKGDNRFGNIHYSNTNANGKLIFEDAEDGYLPASITCASYNGKNNHYNSVIGGNDNTKDSSYGITFNGGVIWAGSQTADNCTAIGAGGNGYGKVYINGGTVTAVANSSGAAIGGGIGESSTGGNALVNITGGEVYAYNFGYVSSMSGSKYFIAGAGIGGGSSCKSSGNATTNITISGGYVFASSLGGAAIGGGSSTMSSGGPATVTISGDAVVEAQSISGTDTAGKPVSAGTAIGGGTAGAAGSANGGNITLNINGGTLYAGSIGGGGCNNATGSIGSGTVNMTNGTVHGQIVMGAGSSSKNTFTMTGGTINNNLSPVSESIYPYEFIEEFGGAVYLESGDVLIDGGIIKNTNSARGGAVYIDGGNFTMNSGTIYNSFADYGGAAYVNSGNFTMNGGSIYDNTASDGGAIFVNDGLFEINAGSMFDNSADYGGAISVANGDFIMSGGYIHGNIADYGGALYMDGGSFNIYNGEFSNNSAIDGGAAYISGADDINIYNGDFDNNKASNNGGAIYATSSGSDIIINVFDGVITNNTAGNHGGAIGASASGSYAAILNIGEEDCLGANHTLHDDEDCPIIDGNTASRLGGAFCLHGNADKLAVNIYCGEVTGNIAIRNPGSNSINQGGGTVTVWGGQIDPGIMVGGGIYTDNRIQSTQMTLRFWSNYPGGPADPHPVEVTVSVTVVFPLDTYVWEGHELSGWATAPDASGLYIPAQGQYAVPSNADGYLDFYAVWDADTSYIVYIPESVDINTDTGIGTMNIAADINYFKKNSNLNIFINSDFELENNGNINDYLEYKLTSSEFGDLYPISNNGIAATFQYNNVLDKALKLILLLNNNNKIYSNGYSDVITFTIEYNETDGL